ncbi:MAG: hypothetical protein P0116_09520 [Candidatus Nitrosocosmicus sp.]|nr:hypothetical protein [Candidatus Nitrosocosmicus sp.]
MKGYGKVTTMNAIILTTVTIVLIGTFVWAIPIFQQKANAGIEWSGGGGQEAPEEGAIHQKSLQHGDTAHSEQLGGFNTSGSHENSTRLK